MYLQVAKLHWRAPEGFDSTELRFWRACTGSSEDIDDAVQGQLKHMPRLLSLWIEHPALLGPLFCAYEWYVVDVTVETF